MTVFWPVDNRSRGNSLCVQMVIAAHQLCVQMVIEKCVQFVIVQSFTDSWASETVSAAPFAYKW